MQEAEAAGESGMSEKDDRPIIIVKKKHGGLGHHGGAWKVAYADFVTAMMAFFLVLWLVGQNEKVKSAVGAYFRDPGAFDKSTAGILTGGQGLGKTADTESLLQETMVLLEKTAKNLNETFDSRFKSIRDQIKVSITKEGLEIQLVEHANKVLFDVGKTTPKAYTEEILKEIAMEIGELTNHVVISGHTDRRGYNNDGSYSNWELSVERANSARRVMIQHGLKPEQVARVIGFADRKPIDPEDPYAAANRRISILVLAEQTAPQRQSSSPIPDATAKNSPAEP